MLNFKTLIDTLSLCKAYYEAPNTIIFERRVLERHGERDNILV